MLIYLLLPIFIIVLYFFSINNKNNPILSKGIVILSVLPMYLLFALRSHKVGFDTVVYIGYFKNICNSNWEQVLNYSSKSEPGIYIFYKLISYVTQNYTVMFFILGLLLFIPIIIFFYKNTENPLMGLILYYGFIFYFYLTALRQSCAISICLISIEFLKKKKYIYFILLVLLAAQFHHSAYLFLILTFYSYFKKFSDNIYFWLILSVTFIFCLIPFYNFITSLLFYEKEYSEIASTNNAYLSVTLFIFLTILCLFYKNKIINNEYKYIFYFMSGIYMMSWIGRLFSRNFERPGMYFSFGLFILLADLLIYFRKNKILFYLSWFIVFISIAYMLHMIDLNIEEFKYSFFFE